MGGVLVVLRGRTETRMNLLAIGIATWYAFFGAPYCSSCCEPWSETLPYIAVPVEQLGGKYQCGEFVYLCFEERCRLYRVWDAGPFSRFHVEGWPQPNKIVVDVPERFWTEKGRSAPVRICRPKVQLER